MAMLKRCILNIGMVGTGHATLRRAFRSHAASNLRMVDTSNGRGASHLRDAFQQSRRGRPALAVEARKSLAARFDGAEARTVFVSDHALASLDPEGLHVFHEWLKQRVAELMIFAYVVPPQRWLEKAFEKHLRGGKLSFLPEDYALPYRVGFERLEAEFGTDVRYAEYDETEATSMAAIRNFFIEAGCEFPSMDSHAAPNEMSCDALRLSYIYRSRGSDHRAYPLGSKSAHQIEAQLARLEGPELQLAASTTLKLLEGQQDTLTWMAERLRSPGFGAPVLRPQPVLPDWVIAGPRDLYRLGTASLRWLSQQSGAADLENSVDVPDLRGIAQAVHALADVTDLAQPSRTTAATAAPEPAALPASVPVAAASSAAPKPNKRASGGDFTADPGVEAEQSSNVHRSVAQILAKGIAGNFAAARAALLEHRAHYAPIQSSRGLDIILEAMENLASDRRQIDVPNASLSKFGEPASHSAPQLYRGGGVFDAHGELLGSSLLVRTIAIAQEADPMPTVAPGKPAEPSSIYGGLLFNHYGHFILESLARAHTFNEQANKGKRIIFQSPDCDHENDIPEFAKKMFEALRIDLSRIRIMNDGRKFHALTVPVPGYFIQKFFSKVQRRFLQSAFVTAGRLAREFESKYAGLTVYMSRASISGSETEVEFEGRLAKSNVLVVRPETLSLPEQVALFLYPRNLIGLVGSAFHTMLFVPIVKPKLFFIKRRGNLAINPNYATINDAFGPKLQTEIIAEFMPNQSVDFQRVYEVLASHIEQLRDE